MLLHEIGLIVREYEEEVLFDVEAPEHWYEVEYRNNNTVILYEIDEYHFNGDEVGEIETSTVYDEIESFNCTLKEFTNFVIQFFETKLLYRNHSYPQEAYVYDKIIIRGIKND